MNITTILQELDELFATHQIEQVEDFVVGKIKEAESINEVGVQITLWNELMGFYRDTSQFDKSIEVAKKAMLLIEQENLMGSISHATTVQNVANALRAAGQLEASQTYYDAAFAVYKDQLPENDMRYASLYNNLSLLFQEMGEFDKSCDCLEQALGIVTQHEEAVIEVATTHTNLAMSLMKCRKLEEAIGHLEEAFTIFERYEERDFHYSAALSAMGEAKYLSGDLESAVEYYKLGMDELERHVGRTKGYEIMEENYKTIQKQLDDSKGLRVQREYPNGMELCKGYYEEFGIPMIQEKFLEYESLIAIGLVGEGSDCFGYDDLISRDHDYGPAFCMWLTDATYDEIGESLQREYDKLPTTYMGVTRVNTVQAGKRVGVLRITEFYDRLIGLTDIPQSNQQWLFLEEYQLATATNGQVFRDDLGEFSRIRMGLLAYYPKEVLVQKIAREAALMAQSGQYNYKRMLKRTEYVTAHIALMEFMKHTMAMTYLLNRSYAPFYKWQHKGMKKLMILSQVGEILAEIEQLPIADPTIAMMIEQIAQLMIARMKEQGLTKGNDNFLESHTQGILLSVKEEDERKKELVDTIVLLEWEAFDKVENIGNRAECQDNWGTFSIMRKSQFMAWNEEVLTSYIEDFKAANQVGWNLITEKYAHMMRSTDPNAYEEIVQRLPKKTERQVLIIEEIVGIQVNWMEEFSKIYSNSANNARSIYTREDSMYNTSYETYLRGELLTYSEQTLAIYGTMIVDLVQSNQNLAKLILTNTALLYGYKSLEDMEDRIER
ncbi:MAG: DUF4125 family protein [Eubacteriales bacterium]